jgi:uncharacterized protein YndB with AHSA1/START domain
MESKIQEGFLLFADITGYEKYLNDVEIEHATGVIQELLELIINQNVPPLQYATVKGDGVLMHLPTSLLDRPEVILELVESTYLSFKDRVKSIDRNNTCGCRACTSAPDLDLKFFVHYGQYLPQHSHDDRVDLTGMDALLLKERKLKNQVENIREPFILFTDASLEKLDLGLTDTILNKAEYQHYGEIPTTRINLSPRYQQLLEQRRTFIRPEEADIDISLEITARPIEIWEWLNDPHLRTKWMRARTWTELKRPGGRLGVGAQNHCGHALGNIIETVLDWNPYNFFTSKTEEGNLQLMQTFELIPSADRNTTFVHWRVKIEKLPWSKITSLIAPAVIKTIYQQDLMLLKKLIQ